MEKDYVCKVNDLFTTVIKVASFFLVTHYVISTAYLIALCHDLGLSMQHIFTFEDILTIYLEISYNISIVYLSVVVAPFICYLVFTNLPSNKNTCYKINKKYYSKSKIIDYIGISTFVVAILIMLFRQIYTSDITWILIIILLELGFFTYKSCVLRKPIYLWVASILGAALVSYSNLILALTDINFGNSTENVELTLNDDTVITTSDSVRMVYHGSKYIIFRNIEDSTNILYPINSIKQIVERTQSSDCHRPISRTKS